MYGCFTPKSKNISSPVSSSTFACAETSQRSVPSKSCGPSVSSVTGSSAYGLPARYHSARSRSRWNTRSVFAVSFSGASAGFAPNGSMIPCQIAVPASRSARKPSVRTQRLR